MIIGNNYSFHLKNIVVVLAFLVTRLMKLRLFVLKEEFGEIPQIPASRSAALSIHLEKPTNESFAQLLKSTVSDSIRDFPINCFFHVRFYWVC